jgi:hypothetical protein
MLVRKYVYLVYNLVTENLGSFCVQPRSGIKQLSSFSIAKAVVVTTNVKMS